MNVHGKENEAKKKKHIHIHRMRAMITKKQQQQLQCWRRREEINNVSRNNFHFARPFSSRNQSKIISLADNEPYGYNFNIC